MEQAIFKTLIYSDIFDYPLTLREIHKWLIGKKVILRQVERTLTKMYRVSSIKYKGEYYFLPGRERLIKLRKQRKKHSKIYLRKIKLISQFFKMIPWVKLVGISGGLSMENVSKRDDIDLFMITSKKRIWISRILILGILSLIGQRRKRSDKKVSGKVCCNILLEEDKLEQTHKDLYTAHEVLQMKVLWQRNGIYSKYLSDNKWAFRYLPNWINLGQGISIKYYGKNKKTHNTYYLIYNTIVNIFEKYARILQLRFIGNPNGMKRIEEGVLYFHPEDYRVKILMKLKQALTKI